MPARCALVGRRGPGRVVVGRQVVEEADAEGAGDDLQIVSDHCPFGGASVVSPVVCAVDRGMVKGMLAALYGETDPETAMSRALGDDTCVTAIHC